MSLHEIIRRFTRGEALPIEKTGVYETRFGDLEKMRDGDLTEQVEHIEYIKESVKAHNKRTKAKAEQKPPEPKPEDPAKV